MNALEDKLKATVMAAALIGEERHPRKNVPFALKWIPAAAAVAALACFLIIPHTPEDTFESPELAYAEVERVFGYISEKIETGAEIAGQAAEPIEMVKQIFE